MPLLPRLLEWEAAVLMLIVDARLVETESWLAIQAQSRGGLLRCTYGDTNKMATRDKAVNIGWHGWNSPYLPRLILYHIQGSPSGCC